MRLKSIGAELRVEPPDQGGDYVLHVTVTDDDSEALYSLMPDEAVALGTFLTFWGKWKIEKESL